MTPEPPRTSRQAALLVVSLSSFLGPFMGSAVNVALPTIGSEFNMSAILLAWVNTAYLLAAATLLVPFGRLGDIYGRKRIYVWGTVGFTISSIVLAIAGSGTIVILVRVAQGLSASMVFATAIPILVSVYPAAERGKALGVTVAAVYLGLSSGPFIGGLITEHLGWRYIFWLNVPLGLLQIGVIARLLRAEWAEAGGARFDYGGSLLLSAALAAIMYGLASLPSAQGSILTILGLVGLAFFIHYEGSVAQPLLNIDLFRRNTVFAYSNLAALINYAATFAVSFLLSIYLQRLRGLSPQEAGFVLVAQPVVQALLSPAAGRLSDRMQPRTVASAGMATICVGLLLLTPLDGESAIIHVVLCQALLGLGFALFSSPNMNAILSSVDRSYYGVAGSLVAAVRQLGMMISMGIVMTLFAVVLGGADIGPETAQGFVITMRLAFSGFAVLCLLGVFASLARGELQRGE